MCPVAKAVAAYWLLIRVLSAPAEMAALEGAVVKVGSRRASSGAERRHGSVGSLLCLNLAGDTCAPGLAAGWDQDQKQEDGGVALECSEARMAVCLGWALARRVRSG